MANGNSVSEKLNGFFGANDRALPMYKDKPYFAPRRTGRRRHRGKMSVGGVLVLVLFLIWYYGARIGFKTPHVAKGVDLWSWRQSFGGESPSSSSSVEESGKKSNNKIDWAARRQKVKDAFIVSWDGYEEHAWGAFQTCV